MKPSLRTTLYLTLTLILVLTVSAAAQSPDDCGLDNWYTNFIHPQGIEPQIVEIVDGSIYVGGSALVRAESGGFDTTYGVFMWDGQDWHYPSYEQGLAPVSDDVVFYDMAVVGTDVYVGGEFNGTNSTGFGHMRHVARWDGEQWHELDGGVDDIVHAVEWHDGYLYIGGEFEAGQIDDSQPLTHIARWNGTAWEGLTHAGGAIEGTRFVGLGSGPGDVYALCSVDDGILVGGHFDEAGGVEADYLAHWNSTTGEWSEFAYGAISWIERIVENNGDVYVSGNFQRIGGVECANIGWWDGSDWNNIDIEDAPVDVADIAVLDNGEFYIGGAFFDGPPGAHYIAHWTGLWWERVFDDCNLYTNVMDLASEGNTLVATKGYTDCDHYVNNEIAIMRDGRWDGLGDGTEHGTGRVYSILADSMGAYVGGSFSVAGGGIQKWGIARWNDAESDWNAMTSNDTLPGVSYHPVYAQPGTVYDQAMYQDNLYVGGVFDFAGDAEADGVAYWNGDEWSSLGEDELPISDPQVMTVYNDELYLSEGDIGITPTPIIRWDGTSFLPVQPDSGSPYRFGLISGITAMAASDDLLYLYGTFYDNEAEAKATIVSWDGSFFRELGDGIANTLRAQEVNVIAVAGADVFVAGDFNRAVNPGNDTIPVGNLARWDGNRWHAMGDFDEPVHALYLRGGELYAGGEFTSVDSRDISGLARWDDSMWVEVGGGVWYPTATHTEVVTISGDDESLWVGGRFTHVNNVISDGIARWTYCTPAPPFMDSTGAGVDVNGTNVLLSWDVLTKGSAATSYRVQLDTATDFGSPVIDLDGIGSTSYEVTGLEPYTEYSWRVRAIEDGIPGAWSPRLTFGTDAPTDVEEDVLDGLPDDFTLSQNYPNPFNPTTSIRYSLPSKTRVSLTVFDITGRRVITLSEGVKSAGQYEVTWDGESMSGERVASGVYLYRLEAGDFTQTRKMLLLK